jgi:hypothetical protein
MVQAIEHPNLHQQFEETFCGILRKADPESFAELKKCEVDFTYSMSDALGRNDRRSQEDYSGTMKGQFDLSHVLNTEAVAALETSRVETVGNCFVDSYNMIHSETPFTLSGFTLEREIQTPETDGEATHALMVEPGSVSALSYVRSWNWYSFDYSCAQCDPAQGKIVPPLTMSRLTSAEHQAFEATFAHCLKESGIAAFAQITNPHIRFIYNGAGALELA